MNEEKVSCFKKIPEYQKYYPDGVLIYVYYIPPELGTLCYTMENDHLKTLRFETHKNKIFDLKTLLNNCIFFYLPFPH
jgi:hypothetical protein